MNKHLQWMRRLGVLVIILLSFGTSTVFAESEPNDTFAEADPIGIGLSNGEVNAFLNDNDLDYFYFTAEAGHTYVIETYNIQGTGGGSATGLWLYNSGQTEITDDRYGQYGTGNTNARIVYTFTTTGTYYVLVRDDWSVNWSGYYSLRILPKYNEGGEWDPANDDEPNDVKELANEIEVGLSNSQTHQLFDHTNYVTNDSDYDFYHFSAEAGQTYVIETYNIQGTGGGSATGLWLYNESGTWITDDRYGQNGTGNANARIVYTFSTTGTYFILVRDDWSVNWTGTYSIRILPKYDEGGTWDPANDNEPNDVKELANEIEVGLSNAQTHELFNHANYVTNDSDYDWYWFTATAGHTYVIETYNIQGTGGGSATGLWLYNESGTWITDDRYGQNGTGNANARITYTFAASGTYFVLVRDDWSVNWIGTYSLRILPKYNEGAEWDPANDHEPNDALPLANPISIGAGNALSHELFNHSIYITNNSDYDYYWFHANAGQHIIIQTFGIQAIGRATGLWLYDASGVEQDNDAYGNAQTGQAFIEFTFTTPGDYFILVKDCSSCTWTGAYSIRVCEDSCQQNIFLPVVLR
ncbi:MAG: hypothetical protein Fur0022_05310 [Anaerolineales bacterium]